MTKETLEKNYPCSTKEIRDEAYQKGRTDKYHEIVSEYMLLTEEQVKQIREDALNDVSAKMEEIISDKCAEYGVGCIEAYCDACGEFEDWIKEQLKGAENEQ